MRRLLGLYAIAAIASGQTFLAYSNVKYGCIFQGRYENGRFTDTTKTRPGIDPYSDAFASITLPFTAGRDYPTITAHGPHAPVRINSLNRPQDLSTWSVDAATSEPTLITTAPLNIEIVPATPTTLTPAAHDQMMARARLLMDHAISERNPDEKPTGYSVGKPEVTAVGEILAVRYPLDVRTNSSHDTRGSLFFLYSPSQSRIIRAEFGHTGWAFNSSAITLQPLFYFRIRGNPQTYFLTDYSGGWESQRYAILNLATGESELTCF